MKKLPKKLTPPKLKAIDLAKCCTIDSDQEACHDHPDIQPEKQYLAKIAGEWFCGYFNREWYGWNFDGWWNNLQLDKPGTNGSDWEELYEIQTTKTTRPKNSRRSGV